MIVVFLKNDCSNSGYDLCSVTLPIKEHKHRYKQGRNVDKWFS